MLNPLFIGQIVDTIDAALDAAAVGHGTVVVLDQLRVANALRERGREVVILAEKRKSLRRVPGARVCARMDALPLATGAAAALVAFDSSHHVPWSPVLAEWSRVVRPGGVVVLVDRASPSELTRRVLLSGLMEIEQRQTGRTFVTSGQVSEL